MKRIAQFAYPKEFKMIVRDSYEENLYYGLDDFDSRYLKIVQAKFGCLNSYHTLPDRVKMELSPFEWSDTRGKFILIGSKTKIVQVNRLENMVISYTFA